MKTHSPFCVGPTAGRLLLARLRTLAEVVAVALLVAPVSARANLKTNALERTPVLTGAWLDVFHATGYDWTVVGFAGKKALDLKTTRVGAHLNWGNAFIRLGYVAGGKQSGTITPDLVAIESLKLRDGSGFSFAGGYLQPFRLANGWEALVGGAVEGSLESYNLVADTLLRLENPTPSTGVLEKGAVSTTTTTTYTYENREASSSVDLREFLATGLVGVRYHQDIWGASGLLCIDLASNVKTEGSLTVNDSTLSLEADRSNPIGVEIGAWCYMFEEPRLEATVRLGSTQLFRVAVSWEW